MVTRNIPLFLRHSPTPRVQNFALLAGLEAAVRGTLISAMPLAVYQALGTAEATSRAYFIAGIVALIWGLMVPWATRHIPRRWMYTLGCLLYLVGMVLAIHGSGWSVSAALMFNAMATATTFVCFNAYVLDYVQRADLGRTQSLQMVYAATPWALGPMLGVWLHDVWAPAPFLLAGGFAMALLTAFWVLRLGNGKQITRAKGPALNPLDYLGRFFRQPRLIAGWMFAVMRSCGWWVYVVYLPIYCIEAGLSDKVGGIALSITNALLFASPFMLRLVRRMSVRQSVRVAFGLCGSFFVLSAVTSGIATHGSRLHDVGVGFPCGTGCGGRIAVFDVCQAFAAHRNVGRLFQFPRCVGHIDAGGGVVGAVGGPACRGCLRRQVLGCWRLLRWRRGCIQDWGRCDRPEAAGRKKRCRVCVEFA